MAATTVDLRPSGVHRPPTAAPTDPVSAETVADMDAIGLAELLGRQRGVVSRPQPLTLGAHDADIKRGCTGWPISRIDAWIAQNRASGRADESSR